LLTYPEAYLSL